MVPTLPLFFEKLVSIRAAFSAGKGQPTCRSCSPPNLIS